MGKSVCTLPYISDYWPATDWVRAQDEGDEGCTQRYNPAAGILEQVESRVPGDLAPDRACAHPVMWVKNN